MRKVIQPTAPPSEGSHFPTQPSASPDEGSHSPAQPSAPPELPSTAAPKHLIIGDSMVKGLVVHDDTAVICKSGIRPSEVLHLLPGSTDILHPDNYDSVRSVTLIVGTNALNITRPGKGMPLLDVIEDYEILVQYLIKLFPNARLGLYNVLPRVYTCFETRQRIELFNSIFDEHVSPRMKNVFWIRQYWEFLDEWGVMRQDLYGKRGIHLKPKGKSLMMAKIRNFQCAYN